MAIIHRNSQQNSASIQKVIVTKPTGTTEGDFLVCIFSSDSSGGSPRVDDNAGWINIWGDNGTSHSLAILYKIATDSEPSEYIFNFQAGAVVAVLSAFFNSSGIGTWAIEDEAESRVSSGNTITSASVTAVNESMLIIGYSNDDAQTVTSAPPNMSEAGEINISSVSCASYYESRSSGAVTKELTWDGFAEELLSNSIVITNTIATGTNIQINIGDVFKEVSAMQINIGDVWKEVVGVQINIGDSWKEVF